MKTKLQWIAVLAVLCTPLTAHADIVWDFWNIAPNGTILPSPQTVTSSGVNITLDAFGNTGSTSPSGVFFDRNLGAGTDERGIGVCQGSVGAATNCTGEGAPGVEVDPATSTSTQEAIRVTLSPLASNYKLLFNSLTPSTAGSEMLDVFAGATFAGATLLGTVSHNQNPVSINGDTPESFSIPNADIGTFIWVTPHTGGDAPNNFLLYGATAAVPEPGTILLLGSGLVGIVLYRRRKA